MGVWLEMKKVGLAFLSLALADPATSSSPVRPGRWWTTPHVCLGTAARPPCGEAAAAGGPGDRRCGAAAVSRAVASGLLLLLPLMRGRPAAAGAEVEAPPGEQRRERVDMASDGRGALRAGECCCVCQGVKKTVQLVSLFFSLRTPRCPHPHPPCEHELHPL